MDYTEEIVTRIPVGEADYADVLAYVDAQQVAWVDAFRTGEAYIARTLEEQGFEVRRSLYDGPIPSQVMVAGDGPLAVLSGRLKAADTVVAKMRRFGEPLSAMLDIWGYRIVTTADLDEAAGAVEKMWSTPTPDELLLRNGELQFEPRRDYREKAHAGIAAYTSDRYDEAIHLNRRAPFGITEVQVMSVDLYRRVVEDTENHEHHDQFAKRRSEVYGGNDA